MHAAHNAIGSGNKMSKIAIVTVLHVGLAVALVNLKVVLDKPHAGEPPIVTFPEDTPSDPVPPPPAPSIKKLPDLTFDPPPLDPIRYDEPPPVAPPVIKPERIAGPTLPPGNPDGEPGGTAKGERKLAGRATQEIAPEMASATGCARPDYPARAARNGETGTVALALLIRADGTVGEAKVQKSSGSRELDRAAMSALSLCTFKPARSNGVAQPAWGQIAYVWSLD